MNTPSTQQTAEDQRRLTVQAPDGTYDVLVGRRLLAGLGERLIERGLTGPVALVTDASVAPLHAATAQAGLAQAGLPTTLVVLPPGEAAKTLDTVRLAYDAFLGAGLGRDATVVALGGGVIGDLTGFAAACYQRGMPFIQVPTTLLAQVDSSVGGKTGINHPLGKNMIGAFYQPQLVLADTDTLATLPDRELSAGLAEVIKYGLIRDQPFLEWLEAHIDQLVARDTAALTYAIRRSCENKAEVVAADEKEAGQRALLNLGHTFGHAIEAGMGYGNWLHGEAVAAGTMLAADLSRRLGNLGQADVDRIARLFRRAGLPVLAPNLGEASYMESMGVDKKVEGGKIRFVLFRKLGEAYMAALRDNTEQAALQATLTEAVARD